LRNHAEIHDEILPQFPGPTSLIFSTDQFRFVVRPAI
jgi:hypothetical protein